jgi:hypothetical protein
VSDTLVVLNEGTDTLVVSGISSDEPAYSVDVTTFDLGPRESQAVLVSFTPGSVGSMPGTLTILSNDPDEGTVYVALEGEGVVPPDIGVAPDSLYADLLTGQTDTQILTIENTGGSDLEWGIGVRASGGDSLRTYALAVPPTTVAERDGVGAPAPARRTSALTARLADLTGVQILWDASHGQGGAWSWLTMVADLAARGATVTESYEPITSELLDGYDVLWTIDCSDTWTSGELSALAGWVGGGGGLLLEGDDNSSVGAYNAILTALGAGITYSTTNGTGGTTSGIYPHETTEGVMSVHIGGPVAHLSSVTGAASVLVDDLSSVPNTACSAGVLSRRLTSCSGITAWGTPITSCSGIRSSTGLPDRSGCGQSPPRAPWRLERPPMCRSCSTPRGSSGATTSLTWWSAATTPTSRRSWCLRICT